VKKVFVVSEFIDPDQNSTGYFWSKIIQKLSQSDAIDKLHVVAPYPSNEAYQYQKLYSDVEFLMFPHAPYNKNSLGARIVGQFKQTYSFSRILTRNLTKDTTVVSGTNPLLLLLLLAVLRLFIPFKWYLLVHDIFPENLVPAGLIKKESLVFKLLNVIFNRVYSRVDHLIVIGRDMKDLLEKRTGHQYITVIPNWVDFDEVEVIPKNESTIIKSLGWEDNIVFQFFGNIGRVQGISNLLVAIDMVENPVAKFLFIGGGAEVETVKCFVADNQNKDKVAYIGELCTQQRSLGLSSCDIAIVTLAEGMLGLGVPSKAYFSMAADKPILAIMSDKAEVASMVKEHLIGWVCPTNDPVALVKLINQICQDRLSEINSSPRSVLQEFYHQDRLLQKFLDIVES